jgi:predicted amidohydrolase
MNNIRIATAQFEHRSGDKEYNLSMVHKMAAEASLAGAEAICFHECSLTGYTFARHLSREALLNLTELVPDGPTVQRLIGIAAQTGITILAGLFEKDAEDRLYKAFVCVDGNGLLAKHRKLHPFIHPNLLPGDQYTVFEWKGWKCGILICYDNNVIENVRATVLLGAQIIFMPHVTMCTPSPRPGAGFVDPLLWKDKEANRDQLRAEFDGPKGRTWLMKWLPARAFDNGIYLVFSNAIGMDDDQLKNGCSMILDPFGDILAECRSLGNEWVMAELNPQTLPLAGGHRYLMARRPSLYADIIGQDHQSELTVAWLNKKD